jgi:hypothetical protein
VIADEVVTDVFAVPACDLERDHYGWSCLPAAMGEPRTAATGRVVPPPR